MTVIGGHEVRMPDTVTVSVVVATRNRARHLGRLLKALAEQVDSPNFEVVVSDNGSSDDTLVVVETMREQLALRVVRVQQPGKGRALNAALALAEGNLIVFTDDDVIPERNWLAQLSQAAVMFPKHNIFGGRIEVNPNLAPKWVKNSFNLMGLLTSAHDKGDHPIAYGYGEYPFGPNMAVRRNLLSSLEAPYPEDMGPGTQCPVGDETGFFIRVCPPEAEDRLFVPTARVTHEIELENVAFKTALKRCYQAGVAHGWLGLAAVARSTKPIPNNTSTIALMFQRVRSTRSLRELACITIRYLGYRNGARKFPKTR